MPTKFSIPKYQPYDKMFVIDGPLPLLIDNDDVSTDDVRVLAKSVMDCLNRSWRAPHAWYCQNEECGRYERAETVSVGPDGELCIECGQKMPLREVSL